MNCHNYFLLFLLLPFFGKGQQWKTFNDSTISFTAKYPPNWINKIKEGKRVFFTSPGENKADQFYENVNISMTRNAAYGTEIKIKEAIPSVLEALDSTIENFTKITERYFKWNNSDACELICTGSPRNSDLEVRVIQWFCFSKQRLFTATYTALASDNIYISEAKKILESIRFR